MTRWILAGLVAAVVLPPSLVLASPDSCQHQVLRRLAKLDKSYLKALTKCIDAENRGTIGGPCPDGETSAALDAAGDDAAAKIAAACTPADLTALGFRSDCQYGTASTPAESACAALPVSNGTQFAACLRCWHEAELDHLAAVLYASHAIEACSGDCTGIGCPAAMPPQGDLGYGAQSTCQKSVGKAGVGYALARRKALAKCGRDGGTAASCASAVAGDVSKAADKRDRQILGRCASLDPGQASGGFCCNCHDTNLCIIVSSRQACEAAGCHVHEGESCPGQNGQCRTGARFLWWGACPEVPDCPGTPVTTMSQVSSCIGRTADDLIDQLLCIEMRANNGADWPCPS